MADLCDLKSDSANLYETHMIHTILNLCTLYRQMIGILMQISVFKALYHYL